MERSCDRLLSGRSALLDFDQAVRSYSCAAPYGHNGYFATLEEIVHFYNTRDVLSWPPPEVPENVNTEELGNLGLTAQEEADLVAFLRTLTDGYRIAPPRGRHRMTAVFAMKE